MSNATSEQFFDRMYRRDEDPWGFATSEYELSRYGAIIQHLSGRTYGTAFEPGCSVGVLTVKLASICSHVQAIDISQTAVEAARQRCAHLPNVTINQGSLPSATPVGMVDLIVFSEIGYYFDCPTLERIGHSLARQLLKNGVFISTSWLGSSPDHLLTGDQVHEALQVVMKRRGDMALTDSQRYEGFRIDQWARQ